MIERTDEWPDNLIKGRIAECIIEEMFKRARYKVYRFGYEANLQNLTQNSRGLKHRDNINKIVKEAPDFIIERNGLIDFIEVKFRSSGKWEVPKDYFWKDGWILLVMPEPPYFKIGDVRELLRGDPYIPLKNEKDFKIDAQLIDSFSKYVRRFLDI
jgi:hypothetical protein